MNTKELSDLVNEGRRLGKPLFEPRGDRPVREGDLLESAGRLLLVSTATDGWFSHHPLEENAREERSIINGGMRRFLAMPYVLREASPTPQLAKFLHANLAHLVRNHVYDGPQPTCYGGNRLVWDHSILLYLGKPGQALPKFGATKQAGTASLALDANGKAHFEIRKVETEILPTCWWWGAIDWSPIQAAIKQAGTPVRSEYNPKKGYHYVFTGQEGEPFSSVSEPLAYAKNFLTELTDHLKGVHSYSRLTNFPRDAPTSR
ncbi:MAG: hypothetical protein Q7S65_05320 [Nanoarchaeota archaeon]|nr:hypothetical protein [Nanoarchaeota archaeon]